MAIFRRVNVSLITFCNAAFLQLRCILLLLHQPYSYANNNATLGFSYLCRYAVGGFFFFFVG